MILLADDNQNVRRLIREILQDIEDEIIECADGKSALAIFKETAPDVVLMDINMRPVDGLTAMQKMLLSDPDARIIIVTEHDDGETRKTALELGACGFVPKNELLDILDLVVHLLKAAGGKKPD